MTPRSSRNDKLRARLEGLAEADRDYWSFRGDARRENGHGFMQYPAMMVPKVAGSVLEQVCLGEGDIETVGDPFVGSGTVLTEGMSRGLAFWGMDVNPLAVLLCRVKAGPFFVEALSEKVTEMSRRLRAARGSVVDVSFRNQDKWFSAEAQIALSRIRRVIHREDALWARRFYWVAMAETVRMVSNSRMSTYKLHIRSTQDIAHRRVDAVSVFERVVERNLAGMRDHAAFLEEEGFLHRGRYVRAIEVSLKDVRRSEGDARCDIIVTSPPYGDNASTIPYGQYSYLPLQWIDLSDIDAKATGDYLVSTFEIDHRSLGGSLRLKTQDFESLADRSASFQGYMRRLKHQPPDRRIRVTAYLRDLDACLGPILGNLRPGGLLVWVISNRTVGGERVPLDQIIPELLGADRVTDICRLRRSISSKRMAPVNRLTATMSTESILVMRKGS